MKRLSTYIYFSLMGLNNDITTLDQIQYMTAILNSTYEVER